MCGIIGITGRDDAVDGVLKGLRRLEYRGYDSAGVVTTDARGLRVIKRAGKLDNLASALEATPFAAATALGHTRWATHGEPTDRNAHPHLDPSGRVAVVHNGIIENYQQLKAELADTSYASDTDTEVVAHLLARELAARDDADLFAAVRSVVARLEGAYALCVVAVDDPSTLVVAKHEAPLIVAHAAGVGYCASDVAALIEHTADVAALLDGQLARITPDGVEVTDVDGAPAEPHRYHVDWDLAAAEKQGYPHFMLKEIHEQPQAVADTLLDRLNAPAPGLPPRLSLDELRIDEGEFGRIDKVFILACGTSLHAAMVGKLAIEHWAGIPVDVEVASEFRYRDPIVDPHTLTVAISQSGETVDTIAAAAHARDQRAPVIAITNVVGSTLAREADGVLYTHAGPEVAVASTKAFTTQIVACLLLGLYLGQARGRVYSTEVADILERLERLPDAMRQVLELDGQIEELAARYRDVDYTMFIGRHAGLPIAMEGALKLKEISYLHAEAFPAGEMKHGPIALIEPGSLVVALAPAGHVFGKMVSNIQEVRARGASVLAIGTEGSTEALAAHADDVLTLPEPPHELAGPVLTVVPLQLFSYHVATLRGEDVDQPRNLAKTVTVE
ncbi:MAG: glutamine--fructose-6-phosphate transaminase (isomerizing) [Nitriliruptoraceae bacterium]